MREGELIGVQVLFTKDPPELEVKFPMVTLMAAFSDETASSDAKRVRRAVEDFMQNCLLFVLLK